MWRVPGFVGRVLNRCHGNSSPLRLSQDEVTSTVLVSTSSQKEDGQNNSNNNKRRSFQFCNAEIPRYTALDAVGWGAAAVIFMHMCRRIHSSFSSGGHDLTLTPLGVNSTPSTPSPPTPSSLLQRLLLDTFSRQDALPVLPGRRTVLCLQGAAESHNSPPPPPPPADTSSSEQQRAADPPTEELSASDWTDRDSREASDWTNRDSREASDWTDRDSREASDWTNRDRREASDWTNRDSKETTQDSDEGVSSKDRLSEAAVNLSQVGESSVPVVLNIIGLQSVQRGDLEAAFLCFHTAALQGYRKAQFNTAVCLETGRGTTPNITEALHFYRLAAEGNHIQAQYRYAKLLLATRGRQRSTEELHTAISLLEKASASGLTQAQLFLASILSEEPIRDVRRSIIYLQMAADRGSSKAKQILAQFYEQNLQKQQATTREAALRSIRSAPCFQRAVQPGSLHFLPHSWSAGNLTGNLHLYAPPPSSDITLGVG